MLPRPVVDVELLVELASETARSALGDFPGVVEVRDREPEPGRTAAGVEESRRVVEAHEHEAAIVLVHAGLEHARDRERALARHQAGRCHERLRQHEHDLAADADVERIGETLADHDLVAAADERADVPFARDRADARHLALELGLDCRAP